LLVCQLLNTVFTSLGIKYRVEGRRMSGDMNTALGNCVLMLVMLHAYCEYMLHLKRWDTLDDGDDCLLIVEANAVQEVLDSLVGRFLEFGMEMKVERPVRSVHEVVFCQSTVIEFECGRYKFVRNPFAVMSKALCGIRHWEDPHYREKVLRAIGACELVLNLSVPVLQNFALAILRNVGSGADVAYAPDGLRARAQRDARGLGVEITNVGPRPISDCGRESFSIAFGICPAEQMSMEQQLDAWTFPVGTLNHWGQEWDVANWLPTHARSETYTPSA